MDAERFDQLTRGLVAATSRRGVLTGAAAAIAGRLGTPFLDRFIGSSAASAAAGCNPDQAACVKLAKQGYDAAVGLCDQGAGMVTSRSEAPDEGPSEGLFAGLRRFLCVGVASRQLERMVSECGMKYPASPCAPCDICTLEGSCAPQCYPCQTCQGNRCVAAPGQCSACEVCTRSGCENRCGQCERCDRDGTCHSACGSGCEMVCRSCEICQQGRCVDTCPACQSCSPVPGGGDAVGRCLPVDCGAGLRCIDNKCVPEPTTCRADGSAGGVPPGRASRANAEVCGPICATGGGCGAFPACDPDTEGCSCTTTTEGEFACTTNGQCDDLPPCLTSANCGTGTACVVNGCCEDGLPRCVSICGGAVGLGHEVRLKAVAVIVSPLKRGSSGVHSVGGDA